MPSDGNHITATDLGRYHTHFCELQLHKSRTYRRAREASKGPALPPPELAGLVPPEPSASTKALFKRGVKWEEDLVDVLQKDGLIYNVPEQRGNLTIQTWLDMILADNRLHYYMIGTQFSSPAFENEFETRGSPPVRFGTFKPDFIEIRVDPAAASEAASKDQDKPALPQRCKIEWRIIDAKSSKKVKISHQVQIGYYWLAIQALILEFAQTRPEFSLKDSSVSFQYQDQLIELARDGFGEVWIPHKTDPTRRDPAGCFSVSVLRPLLEDFLFRQLPSIMAKPAGEAAWHLREACQGCEYMDECRAVAVSQQTLSAIPNLSSHDFDFLKQIIRYQGRGRRLPTGTTEIEDLASLFQPGRSSSTPPWRQLSQSHALAFGELCRILKIVDVPSTSPVLHVPMLESTRRSSVEVLGARSLLFPRDEDVGVYLSVGINPATEDLFYYSIYQVSKARSRPVYISRVAEKNDTQFFASFVKDLARVIRSLDPKLHRSGNASDSDLSVQFYVFDKFEYDEIVSLLVNAACYYEGDLVPADEAKSETYESTRICIGALVRHSDVLLSTVQPELFEPSTLFSVASTTLKPQLQKYVSYFSNNSENINARRDELLETLDSLLSSKSQNNGLDRLVPPVVALSTAVRELFALPVAGFFDIDDCVRCFNLLVDCKKEDDETVSVSSNAVYTAWEADDYSRVEKLLRARVEASHQLVRECRRRLESYCATKNQPLKSILLNTAPIFDVTYVDFCKDPHLRRLMFMAQFEMLTELQELRRERCQNTKPIVLEYFSKSNEDFAFNYRLIQGSEYIEEDDAEFFGWLLVKEGTDADLYFDDLKYMDTISYRLKLDESDSHLRGQLVFSSISKLMSEQSSPGSNRADSIIVTLKHKDVRGFKFAGGRFYLRRRLINFNTKKLVRSLIDTDIENAAATSPDSAPLFLRLVRDPNDVGALSIDSSKLISKAADIQRLYKERGSLDPNDMNIKSLTFLSSQSHAFTSILQRPVSLIWGPPGHGKTHTLALSTIRLIEIVEKLSAGQQPIKICMTAFTHAAIDNYKKKLETLLKAAKSISFMNNQKWINQIEVNRLGGESRSPSKPNLSKAYTIVCSTVWQLSKIEPKDRDFDVLIIDEGSQMPLSDASIAISMLKKPGPVRLVIAGDHLQLSPVLRGSYPAFGASDSDPLLFGSIMDCVLRTSDGKSVVRQSFLPTKGSDFGPFTQMLMENFRMVPKLCRFSETLYGRSRDIKFIPMMPEQIEMQEAILNGLGGQQSISPSISELLVLISTADKPLVTIKMHPALKRGDEFSPYERHVNAEMELVAGMVKGIRSCGVSGRIFVVTPHRLQRSRLTALLSDHPNDLRIDTVERMQGDEAEIVIVCYGFTSHEGQMERELDFIFHRNRLNVALSRARSLCILVASKPLLEPPMLALASATRREAFAHIINFRNLSCVIDWEYSVSSGIGNVADPGAVANSFQSLTI
ncbi:uncharacterized protein BJ171DRAFT_596851 [Polychytrium aggregatum]|uniref:uncharacterized protein n=1 Tax=Polychytrium aggregatum TaxID=110093 RepID=UPI0022FF1B42|nr:uncharacterized protein BJ171DRAFT_596851 [Polychytrium aggregatum]KAI9207287.1 hypothetical protein BJ171DRAFT_596851 [Polychytrium aggregatum]